LPLSLGNFPVSLAVKNLAASRAVHEKLGYGVIGGNPARHCLILQDDARTIGLFPGKSDWNLLTDNPGWDRSGNAVPDFADMRDLRRSFRSRGVALATAPDKSTMAPASFTLLDSGGAT